MNTLPALNDVVLLPRETEICNWRGGAGFEFTRQPREYTVGFVVAVDTVGQTADIMFARDTEVLEQYNPELNVIHYHHVIQPEYVYASPISAFNPWSPGTFQQEDWLYQLTSRKYVIDTKGWDYYIVERPAPPGYDPNNTLVGTKPELETK